MGSRRPLDESVRRQHIAALMRQPSIVVAAARDKPELVRAVPAPIPEPVAAVASA